MDCNEIIQFSVHEEHLETILPHPMAWCEKTIPIGSYNFKNLLRHFLSIQKLLLSHII